MTALVMVVEEDERLARIMGWILEEGGFKADLVNRREAVPRAERTKPDVVVLNGTSDREQHAIARSLLDRCPDVRLVGVGEPGDERHGRFTEASGYVQKPFHADDLVREVEQSLRGGDPTSTAA